MGLGAQDLSLIHPGGRAILNRVLTLSPGGTLKATMAELYPPPSMYGRANPRVHSVAFFGNRT